MRKAYFFYIFIVFTLVAFASPIKAVQKKLPEEKPQEVSIFNFKELILSIEGQKEVVPLDKLKEWSVVEPSLKINSEKRSEIENIEFCPSDPIFCRLVSNLREKSFLKKETRISVDKEKIRFFIDELATKFDKDPVNAKLKIDEGGTNTFAVSEEGMKINVDESAEMIAANLTNDFSYQDSREINLKFDIIQPEIKTSDINNLGIDTLIGEGKSNFRGSPKNRVFNINVATEKFNGALIKPGEEFSFIATLGPVDGEHGYAPELVIKQDKTEPEFGGGICQVSTTAFRAAINSGLKITMRRNHAYPVAYYNPQGMDATVYVPKPDLRFINNTPNYILIQTKIEGTTLIFQFYGTNDERKVEVIGPKVLKKEADGSMKTSFTQKVYDKDENLIINDVFNSNYDSPSKYPHPGEEKLTKKPKGWSDKEWKKYKQTNGI